MSHDLIGIKERLDRIANTPRTTPPIDVIELAARGRRARRRRASLTAGVTAACLAGTFLTAGWVVDLHTRAEPDPRVAVTHGAMFPNPLVQRASFGWLPRGYGVVKLAEDHQGPGNTFVADAGPDGKAGEVSLIDFGAGPEPPLGNLHRGIKAKRLPARSVNGREAYWIAKPGTEDGGRLRWTYGRGKWAELEVMSGPLDKTATIYKIAESVAFGKSIPTAFPFRIEGMPALLEVKSAGLRTGSWGPAATLMLHRKGNPLKNSLNISVDAARDLSEYAGQQRGIKPNTTIDGHAAYDSAVGGVGRTVRSVIVFGVDGFDVRIDAGGDALRLLEPSGGVEGLYRRLTVLGTDPARWTTKPLG